MMAEADGFKALAVEFEERKFTKQTDRDAEVTAG